MTRTPRAARLLHHAGWLGLHHDEQAKRVLYTGVTSKLPTRAWQHREGAIPGFTKRYNLKVLVYFEWHDEIIRAIQREKNIKGWPRAWKIDLIESTNPEWKDLYDTLA